jgi:multidrug efflux pump
MNFNLARWCVKHRQVVYFFTALIFIAGIYCFNAMGRSEDPSYVVRQMVISAAWPGATADQMQDLVTSKIDKMVQATPDIDYITSYSRPGVTVVNVILKEQVPNTEVRKHWLEVRNYVNDHASELPSGVYGPYFDDRFDDVYGNIYALTSDDFSMEELRVEAEELKRQFFTVPDVKKVELVGEQPMNIYVRMSNAKLAELGLTLSQVTTAINGETAVAPTGRLDNNGDDVYMRVTGITKKLDDIRAILINANGKTFRLGDIATVTQDYPDPPEPKMFVNGKQAIGIAISMEDGGNNITLGHNLDKLTAQMQKQLPLGMELHQVANQPKVVEESISEFTEGLYEAIIIVLVVSLLSMGRQCGYVISVCIPLMLMGAIVGMYLLGIDLHKISLGSLIISLGMLVDDAIVVVELMEVKMSEGMDRLEAASYAYETNGRTLCIGTMITCVSFLPIAFSNCNVSEYAGSLFPVITITLMFSWLVSQTLAPTLGYEWIHPKVIQAESYDTPFYNRFRKLLDWCMHHGKTVCAAALACLIGSLGLMTLVKQEFFPESVRPEVITELNLPEGSGIKQSEEAMKTLMEAIDGDPDIDHYSAYIGKSAPRFILVLNPVQPRNNYAQLVTVAKDVNARKRVAKKIDAIVREKLPEVVTYSKSVPLGPPKDYPVMFRVSAPTTEYAREYANKVRAIMAANPDVTMTICDWMEKAPAVKIEIDNDRLKQIGLTRSEVSQVLYANVSGYTFSHYYDGDQNRSMIFQLDKKDRNSLHDVQSMTIPTSSGSIPLSQVARITPIMENNMIWRRNLQPTITVSANVGEGVTGNDVAAQLWKDMKELRNSLPPGVSIEIDGPLESSQKATRYLMGPVPGMLIAMLVLLMLEMKDVRKLFVILCTAPLCITGIAIGLLLFDAPMGVMAEVGSLALIGTVIRNSMVIIQQIDLHREQGMDDYTAVVEASIVRFRPIMLAALTTIFGLVPMFTNPFWNAMAIAMACGLTGATALTLVFLPTLYCMVFHVSKENVTTKTA